MCITTRGEAARVHALLSLVRPYVEEIVLAVDDRAGPETLAVCEALADQRFTFAFAAPPVRVAGWLQHQCRADWILRLDDDEVPGQALLDALGDLTSTRRLTHYGLTRRWLHGDARTYLASPPWRPDYQLRLLRNIRSLWSFTGRMHEGVRMVGEGRFVDLPIYHADLLVNDLAARREKAVRYERLRPGHVTEGVSVNAMYVPEDSDDVVTEPVPGADAALIAAVLDPPPPAAVAPGAALATAVPHAGRFEVDRYITTRDVPPSAYRARIEFVRPVTRIGCGVTRDQEVVAENLGDERWPPGDDGEPLIRLGSRWLRDDGEMLGEGPRGPFTETVVPGARSLARLQITAPDEPGLYVLEVDVVHEHVRWFACGSRLEIEVVGEGEANAAGPAGPATTRRSAAHRR
ncbi:MAG: hypothetical protein QOG15_2293 [Solirubrobacteraceae bacterium]|nr:hypothetical protein [Solirubrobacteraceae bacterium]